MSKTGLLIDFGSTFTKVTAVDLEEARIIGRAQSPSTVGTDVCEGLLKALNLLHQRFQLFKAPPADLDALDGFFVRACSSAAGGLRIVVAGLVPGLTVEAANAAALGAGAKVVGAFCFKLQETDIEKIAALKPDLILLTGGMEGGDIATIVHNAGMFARSVLKVPYVMAGNTFAADQVVAILTAAGKEVARAENVLPGMNQLNPEPAQEEIRTLFMRRIVEGKGLSRLEGRVPVVLPTPLAVQKAAYLGSQGHAGGDGCGELLLVDVGGATTDVYSIGEGRVRGQDIIPKGMPDPFAKRTVVGDLGLRINAATILSRVGTDFLYKEFTSVFPELPVVKADMLDYIESLSGATYKVPTEEWQAATDAMMARCCADIAIERHVGRREPYFGTGGRVWLQSGKDLTEVANLLATGGIFTHNPYVERILSSTNRMSGRFEVLRPENPRILRDKDYVLYAVGLLGESHPEAAIKIFRRHLGLDEHHHDHDHGNQRPAHAHAGHDDDCCDH
jgi:uncharacterized protein (TIGR01319 family)